MKKSPLQPLIAEAAPDFSQPLDLLYACHCKILQHCRLLVDLCQYLEKHPADEQAHTACRRIYRYFSESVVFHHQDEEHNLFPLLIRAPGADRQVTPLISQLKLDHFELDRQWLKLEALLRDEDLVTLAIMTHEAQSLENAYSRHIELENSQLLPMARQLLDEDMLTGLGEKMQQRRQQTTSAA